MTQDVQQMTHGDSVVWFRRGMKSPRFGTLVAGPFRNPPLKHNVWDVKPDGQSWAIRVPESWNLKKAVNQGNTV
jgi:hypothetical protein